MGFRRVNLGWLLQHASFLFSVFPDYLIDIGLEPSLILPAVVRITKKLFEMKIECVRVGCI